jgi:hypothetical protein
MSDITQKAKMDYLNKMVECECGGTMGDIFSIKQGAIKKLLVKGVEIGA